MFEEISRWLLWLLSSTGPTLAVLALIGFMFREKWKQLLSRSLSVEIEELKHGFQKDLEAYKVSLIAQAEEVKIRGDVRKSIASKFESIRFDRLIELESAVSKVAQFVIYTTTYTVHVRTEMQLAEAVEMHRKFRECWSVAEMFLTGDEILKLKVLNEKIVDCFDNIGEGKPQLRHEDSKWIALVAADKIARAMIREKIHAQAAI